MTHAEDELAVRALVARFTDAVNRRMPEDLSGLFTDTGEWIVPGMPEIEGGAAAAGQLGSLLDGFSFLVQLVHSGRVELAGERASARWYISEWAQSVDGAGWYFVGTYHDQVVRSDDGWLFASRRFDFLYRGRTELAGRTYPLVNPEVGDGIPWPP
ncbi:MAG: nuclear transport factor 2 family protein [Microthrixaceae bacterium]